MITVENIILMFEKELRDIKKREKALLKIIENLKDDSKPRCPYCHVSNLRINRDDSVFCRSCGEWSTKIGRRIIER